MTARTLGVVRARDRDAARADLAGGPGPVTGAVAAELRTLTTRRALAWSAPALVVVSAALAALLVGAPDTAGMGDEEVRASLALFTGYSLIPYAAAFLGCVSVTGEFGSGVSRSLYGWVPRRWPVVVAKAAVSAGVGAALALLCLGGAGAGIVLGAGPTAVPGAGTPSAVAGAVLAAALLAVLGVAAGALVRRTALAVVLLGALLVVSPVLLGSLALATPGAAAVVELLPMPAANALVDPAVTTAGLVAPATALLAWAAGGLAAGAAVLCRADL